jgi:hypothetical protein
MGGAGAAMGGASALSLLVAAGDAAALAAVLSNLGAEDLGRVCCVCRTLRLAASSPPLWSALCASEWAAKTYVAPGAREALDAGGDAYAAFRLARADAARCALTDAELTSLPWRFRFKAEAGPEWVARDPYWRSGGGAASRVAFFADGRLRRTPPPSEQERGQQQQPPWPDATITWRWARFGAGRSGGATRGALLRCCVEGAPVPTYAVRRHPAHWGWLMESCWGLYTSFEPPPPGEDPLMDDEGLTVTAEVQSREAHAYNIGFPLDEDDVAATHGAALRAALATGAWFGGAAVTVRSAAAAAARHWLAAPAQDPCHDLVYIGAVALGHAERGDGGRVSHVLLPRGLLRDFMLSLGFGVAAAGVPNGAEADHGALADAAWAFLEDDEDDDDDDDDDDGDGDGEGSAE